MIEQIHTVNGKQFEGERPLFAMKGLRVEHSRFTPGESPLKHCTDVDIKHCEFMAKYPLWHGRHVSVEDSLFMAQSRAAIWYTQQVRMKGCRIDAPKMFRRVEGLSIEDCIFSDAAETGWSCQDVRLKNVRMQNCDYLFMNSAGISAEALHIKGNYSFDSAQNIVVRNSVLESKDAFWNTENVTVYDSILEGEYLGWHSKNLKLVNCTIKGTQPLCFATDLVMENCLMDESCDRCFEYSSLHASIHGNIRSVKNPMSGEIEADEIGELISDEHARNPGACLILIRSPAMA